MSGIIGKEQLLEEAKIQASFKNLEGYIQGAIDKLDLLAKEAAKANTALGGGLADAVKNNSKSKKAAEELDVVQKEITRSTKEYHNILMKLGTVQSELTKNKVAAKLALKQELDLIEEEITGKKAAAKATKDLSDAEKQAGIESKRLSKERKDQIADVERKIKADEKEIAAIKRKAEAIKNLNDKQQLQRAKLVSTAEQYPTNTVENVNARIKIAEYDKRVVSQNDKGLIDRESAFIKKLNEEKKQLIATNKQLAQSESQAAKPASMAATSYDALSKELNQAIRAYKAFTQAQRDDTAIGGAQLKRIQALDSELKQLDATMGRNQRNVGNYKSGFNGLNFSIMQVGRELPSLAYGFSTFVGAISNNIPMVTDEITRARKELAELHAKGEKGVPIWKQLMGAIFSWQTAMVVGLTVLTLYGREIAAWASKIFKAKEAVDELKIAQESLNKIKAEGRKESQSELTRLDLLWSALKSVNTSSETRNKIIKELQEKYPDYFKNLSEETLKLGTAEKGYWQLRDAIIASANARVFAETIAKNREKIELDIVPKLDELKPKLEKAKKDLDEMLNYKPSSFSGNMAGTANPILGAYQTQYNDLKQQVDDLNKEKLRIDAENFRLSNMVDVGALVNDYGVDDNKDSKKTKDKKEQIKDLKDFTVDLMEDEQNANKEMLAQIEKDRKESVKRIEQEQKDLTNKTIADSLAFADEEKLSAQEVALEDIKAAKGSKDAIEDIQHELTMFMIDEDIAAQQRILDTKYLEVDAYADASERIRRLRLQRGEEELSDEERLQAKKDAIRNETMQSVNAVLQEGLTFSKQIYSNQAERAQEAYDAEMKAAGDSVEAQIVAKRKFEEEDKKIRRRQAIADKLQAIFNAGLNLALAIGTPNVFTKPFLIAAATIGLATAVATPIPQYFKGTDNAPETFIGGDTPDGKGATELIELQSGKSFLTPAKATLFSDPSFKGAKVYPNFHDKTQAMLNSYAVNGGSQVFIDMTESNSHLKTIANNTKNTETRFINAHGKTVLKRGLTTTTLV